MKKAVTLLIGLITLVMVCVVAFFGVYADNLNEIVYIQKVEICDMYGNSISENSQGLRVLTLDFDPDLEDDDGVEYMQYFFTVKLNEGYDEPTNENVLYSFSSSNAYISFAMEGAETKGAILIKEKTTTPPYAACTITCKANDGGTARDTIYLLIQY